MEMNEAIDIILDHLREHGTIESEVASGPWLNVTWSDDTEAGELRGTVGRLKDQGFAYSRTLSIGTMFVRSVFGQEETIIGGSVADLVEVAKRLTYLKPLAEATNPSLSPVL